MLRMIVQVLPSSLVRTSIRPPLLATPAALGASLDLLPSCARTSSRWLQAIWPASAGRGRVRAVKTRIAFNMVNLLFPRFSWRGPVLDHYFQLRTTTVQDSFNYSGL